MQRLLNLFRKFPRVFFVAFLATAAVAAAPAEAARPVYAIRELQEVTIYRIFTPLKSKYLGDRLFVHVKLPNGATKMVIVVRNTWIVKGNDPGSLADLQVGHRLRVRYIPRGALAVTLEVLPPQGALPQPGDKAGAALRKVRLAEKRDKTVRLSISAGGAVRFYTKEHFDGEALGLRLAENGGVARPVKIESFGDGTLGYTFQARRPGRYRLAVTRVLSNSPPPGEKSTEFARATTTVILTVKP